MSHNLGARAKEERECINLDLLALDVATAPIDTVSKIKSAMREKWKLGIELPGLLLTC